MKYVFFIVSTVIIIVILLVWRELLWNFTSYLASFVRICFFSVPRVPTKDPHISLCELYDGTKFHVHNHDGVIGRVMCTGYPWEEFMHHYFCAYASEAHTAIDVGANIGSHSVYMSKYFEHVYAFEPQSHIFDILKKNIAINGIQNITAFQIGLGSEDTTAHLEHYDLSTSINQSAIGISEDDTTGEKIKVRRLDDFHIENVRLVKIDVEGYEYFVLKGGEETIRRCRPIILIELLPNNKYRKKIDVFFASHGYHLRRINTFDFIAIP